jgi:hypothetical protein
MGPGNPSAGLFLAAKYVIFQKMLRFTSPPSIV